MHLSFRKARNTSSFEQRVPPLFRRDFLKLAAAALIPQELIGNPRSAPALPTMTLGGGRVTRLVAGSNPLWGGSHFNHILSGLMREYFTDDRVVQFLLDCQRAGINTWQTSFGERPQQVLRRSREAGATLNWICLAGSWEWDPARMTPTDLHAAMMKSVREAASEKPLGFAYHGEVSDRLWRMGQFDQIRSFLDGVHDLGFAAGISTHNPAVIAASEEKGWPADFYMGCFYRESRIAQEFQKEIGVVPVGETYLSSDPARMCQVIKQAQKPCLGFKILAAGRRCDSAQQIRDAFQFAFRNVKPTDGVIVGMFPKLSDHIAENTRLVREIAA
ncbi:MAG: hypothetical protein ACE145_02465 [Terriglobia bacterium]